MRIFKERFCQARRVSEEAWGRSVLGYARNSKEARELEQNE